MKASSHASDLLKGRPIVAIGASLGGLEAMAELLKSVPTGSGMAFIYVQQGEKMPAEELLARLSGVAPMKVAVARHETWIEPDCLYVIPQDQGIQFADGLLLFRHAPRKRTKQLIDNVLTELDRRYKAEVIGVLLSGDGQDGTGGLKAIKIAGGLPSPRMKRRAWTICRSWPWRRG